MNVESILSWAVAAAALTAAIVVAIKTPKEKWFNPKTQGDPNQAWAPEFTAKEKRAHMAKHGLWLVPLMIGLQLLLRALNKKNLLCEQTWGLSHWHWFIAVMLLLLLAVFIGAVVFNWLYWQKVRQSEQFPLPGQKVWKPQRIITGQAAQQRAKLYLSVLACLGLAFMVCVAVLFYLIQGLITPAALAAKCAALAAA
ncbi:hypothetical protein [Marinicella meishanensis]|uniref:hypothetical protein n=1 Tax=Marinicella meishanensis TaxID=2873263 RepID=UPI001CBAD69E|nr:hypothetical protein [Marinicella sp. NBU2979]